jgi:hypothetical protein
VLKIHKLNLIITVYKSRWKVNKKMEKEQVKRHMIMTAIAAFILSACGAKAVPTIDSTQMQASAIAMVNTFVAMTQAAIPPTPVPTDTPLPSPTSLPSSTPSPLSTRPTGVTPVGTQSGTDPCKGPLSANPGNSEAGKSSKGGTNILIVNDTKASITFSLYLAKNIYEQCGYVSYVIARGNSMLVSNTLPRGCYYGHAYIDDPKKPSQVSSGPTCITGVDKTTFTVTMDRLKVTGP